MNKESVKREFKRLLPKTLSHEAMLDILSMLNDDLNELSRLSSLRAVYDCAVQAGYNEGCRDAYINR